MISESTAMPSSYDQLQVALSVSIAFSASYAALELAGRVTAGRGKSRAWLTSGAVAMGIGIWSMHYVGMLAFRLLVPIAYYWPTVLLSLLIGILSSAFALFVVSREKMGLVRASIGSLILGSGIATLHYVAMDGMRLTAVMRFSRTLVALSVVLAVASSLAALWLGFRFREKVDGFVRREIGSAAVMGAAISFMHYTGMAAASFLPSTARPDP
jgi:two-component system, sensor histidine kinase and response regulator